MLLYNNLRGAAGEKEDGPLHYLTEETLPEILSPEEEKELVNKLTTDERMDAREALVLRNMRLVSWIARKYRSGLEQEELISVGIVGLIKAVDSFDPSFQRRVGAYASRCIENEILMYLRKEKRIEQNEACVGFFCPDEKVPWRDQKDPVGNAAVRHVLSEELCLAVNCLKPDEKRFLMLRYGENSPCSQARAAELLGMSQSCLSRKERKILRKLRASMGG